MNIPIIDIIKELYSLESTIDCLNQLNLTDLYDNETKTVISNSILLGTENLDIYKISLNDLCDSIKEFLTNINYISAASTAKSLIDINEKTYLNPFHILFNFIKTNLFNLKTNTYFTTVYFDKNTNIFINMTDIIKEIVETIQFYDENYLYNFVSFHFYGLFYDMLINE
jgi:hypothetical protein